MALHLSQTLSAAFPSAANKLRTTTTTTWSGGGGGAQTNPRLVHIRPCECRKESSSSSELGIGSPIIIVEAPAAVKTAEPMPRLKLNNGFVKQGDVGRVVARKPKDVWAVRLSAGTFLIDAKYLKPLDVEE